MKAQKAQKVLFTGFVALCVVLAVGYVLFASRRNTFTPVPTETNSAIARVTPIATIQLAPPQLISLNKENNGNIGHIQTSAPNAGDKATLLSTFRCERVYYASGTGICLGRTFLNPFRADISITVFGPDLQPKFQLSSEGIPSRARVSRDGKLAAYTTFVTGHNYTDVNLSTKTMLLDVVNQTEIGNLETFSVFTQAQRIQAPDFNFWGVTFAADGNTFYATLRTKGQNSLVRGDIRQKRMDVIYSGVECPSLSPDGTRIAFKRLNPDKATWRIFVLDLATMTEKPMSETRNVDDQVEWLNDTALLYEWIETSAYPRLHVMTMPADGTGSPTLFLADAASPSLVR